MTSRRFFAAPQREQNGQRAGGEDEREEECRLQVSLTGNGDLPRVSWLSRALLAL